jgi:hypothetical protein
MSWIAPESLRERFANPNPFRRQVGRIAKHTSPELKSQGRLIIGNKVGAIALIRNETVEKIIGPEFDTPVGGMPSGDLLRRVSTRARIAGNWPDLFISSRVVLGGSSLADQTPAPIQLRMHDLFDRANPGMVSGSMVRTPDDDIAITFFRISPGAKLDREQLAKLPDHTTPAQVSRVMEAFRILSVQVEFDINSMAVLGGADQLANLNGLYDDQ